MSEAFDLFVEKYHGALDAVVKGNPAPMKELYSRRDDVTLANPLGPPVRGWTGVEKTMERAIANLRGGEATHFERISGDSGTELAYIVEIERTQTNADEDRRIRRTVAHSSSSNQNIPI